MDGQAVYVFLRRPLLGPLDAWTVRQPGPVTRPEAIRRILASYVECAP